MNTRVKKKQKFKSGRCAKVKLPLPLLDVKLR